MTCYRTLAASLLAAVLPLAAAHAAWPEKPITMVVTYPPGGTVDTVARIIGPKLSNKLGQSVIIDNKGGAGGMIGGAAVARSAPDGYTFMFDASSHAQNPALQSRMTFDTLKDFQSVSLLLRVPNVLVTTPSNTTFKSVQDVITSGKSPNAVYFASAGPGSAQHLAGELFNVMAGTSLVHIAYKGGGPAMVDVMSGQVPIMFASLGSAWTHIQSGKLRPIAVGGEKRSPVLPELPTIAESGVPGFASYEWNAVFAPAGTPRDIVDKMSAALADVLKDPEVKAKLEGMGAEIVGSTPEELEAFRRAEIEKWKNVVKQSGIAVN
ncbi:LacI family transcriptional regulator [Bordetella genomosp. 7]|uniref:tripartite tricarboxylate transporter substrate binding protein n=1 Tax=Bordetella TaxID=517 RepID=UPI00047CA43A|nr:MULTISPECIES: tripartite tricarboxylate transporter substrate binding protein [Bordetella]OZI24241.1 LacI family transcriptional regulator [Bordetella genomosp. 7]